MIPEALLGLAGLVTICEAVDYSTKIGDKIATRLGISRIISGNKNKQLRKSLMAGFDAVQKSNEIKSAMLKKSCSLIIERLKVEEIDTILNIIAIIRRFGHYNSRELFKNLIYSIGDLKESVLEDQVIKASSIFVKEVNTQLLEAYSKKDFNLLLLDLLQYQSAVLIKNYNLIEKIIKPQPQHKLSRFIDEFSKYQQLIKSNTTINLKWLLIERDFPIEDLWTEIRVFPKVSTRKHQILHEKLLQEKTYDLPIYPLITKITEKSPIILIFGIGGCGKSTLLKHLEVSLLSEDPEKRILPLRISLYDFSERISKIPEITLEDYIVNTLRGNSPSRLPFETTLDEISSCFNLWLLIDAVDEIKFLQEPKANLKLEALLRSHPLARIIITTRPTGKLLQSLSDIPTFEIKELTRPQIFKYYKKFLGNVYKESKSEQKAKEILNNLFKSSVQPAINTFLMAALYTIVYREAVIQKSQTKFEFLKRATTYLLSKWDEVNDRFDIIYANTRKILPPELLEKIVTRLAYTTLIKPSPKSLGFDMTEVTTIVADVLRDRSLKNTDEIAKIFIRYLSERAGFITDIETRDKYLAFPHRIFRDFFAMVYIKDTYESAVDFCKEAQGDQLKLSIIPLLIAGFCDHRQFSYAKKLTKVFIEEVLVRYDFGLFNDLFNEVIELGVDLYEILSPRDIITLLEEFFIKDLDIIGDDYLGIYDSKFIPYIMNLNWIEIKESFNDFEREIMYIGLLKLAIITTSPIYLDSAINSLFQGFGFHYKSKSIRFTENLEPYLFHSVLRLSNAPSYIHTLKFPKRDSWNIWFEYAISANDEYKNRFMCSYLMNPLRYALDFQLTNEYLTLLRKYMESNLGFIILMISGIVSHNQPPEIINQILHYLLTVKQYDWPTELTRETHFKEVSDLLQRLEDKYFKFEAKSTKIHKLVSIMQDEGLYDSYISFFPIIGEYHIIESLIALYENYQGGIHLNMVRKEFIKRVVDLCTWDKRIGLLYYSEKDII